MQLYGPAAFEIPQLPPVAPAKLTPLSGEPLTVTVPLTVKVAAGVVALPARSQVARPLIERERHAVEDAALQADQRRRHVQAHPLSHGRQGAHEVAAHRAVHAPGDRVRAPVRPVLPTPVVPLQHHFGRRIHGIEVHVRKERFTHADAEGVRGVEEVVLVEPAHERGLMRERPGERRRVATHPIPAVGVARRDGARGQRIVEPHGVETRRRRVVLRGLVGDDVGVAARDVGVKV